MKNKIFAFLTLFSSASTLVCCALPALFVALGFGAAFAGLVTKVPQLIWISEHKLGVFAFGATMLALGGVMQWRGRNLSCPTDPQLAQSCQTTRRWSPWLYFASLGLYLVGFVFAFGTKLLAFN